MSKNILDPFMGSVLDGEWPCVDENGIINFLDTDEFFKVFNKEVWDKDSGFWSLRERFVSLHNSEGKRFCTTQNPVFSESQIAWEHLEIRKTNRKSCSLKGEYNTEDNRKRLGVQAWNREKCVDKMIEANLAVIRGEDIEEAREKFEKETETFKFHIQTWK
ncbi:MAG: hypothetical protein V1661_00805 [bacterium]